MQFNTELHLLPEFIKLRNEIFGISQNFNGITLMGLYTDELFIHLVDGYKSSDNLRNSVTYEEYMNIYETNCDPCIKGFDKSKQKINLIHLDRFIKMYLSLIPTNNPYFKNYLKEKLSNLTTTKKLDNILDYLGQQLDTLFVNNQTINQFYLYHGLNNDSLMRHLCYQNIVSLMEFKFTYSQYYLTLLDECIKKLLHKSDRDKLSLKPVITVNKSLSKITTTDLLHGQQIVIRLITDYGHISDKEILELHNIMLGKPLKELNL